MAHLLANERIRSYGCDSVQSAASFFTKACVPGAMNQEYQPTGLSFPHMCDLCHGTSFRFCRRDHSEDYFGNTGAFRCLVEGGGHVAFVRHATVLENTDGKSREYWSRNQLSRDYELLCRDGQRAPFQITPVAIWGRSKLMQWLQGEDVATTKQKSMRL